MKVRFFLVAAVAAAVAAPSAASAHPGLPLNVFDPVSTSWASVRDATEAQFHDAVDARAGQNMIMVDLEADSGAGGPRFGGVFQRNSDDRRWIVDVTLTEAELEAGPVDQWDPELRLVDVEVYLNRDGVRTFAALWVENLEGYGWTTAHDLTAAQAQDLYEAQRRDRLPIDVDVYPWAGGGVRYAMIWLDNPGHLDWRLHLDQSSAQFAASFDAYSDAGLRLLMVDSAVRTGAGQRYASIWLDNTNGRQWRERRDLTSAQYATWWDTYARDGFRLITYERYETAAGTRYAGVWRQN
ncbi:hypothetical protein KZZ52_39170 [Dactylosporangium sp. AC04546]|uniref:hypothetical protein n=1 Tax=Dactylosporangium sp. AC04546 TaxID=2862460 RepID=UPI001EDE19A0|nr:hypothetical protein [Dactylosporangium sp. AC04546]WVK79972.1 hypothetical protein KZZ52_39170 [Dactylosporangium sp. AC04546]